MPLNTTPMDFTSLEAINIPVTILKGGPTYWLRRATGDAATKYRNYQLRCTVLGAEGNPQKVDGMANADPFLVSMCLWDKEIGGANVPEATIKSWDYPIQKALVTRTKEISELADEDTIEALEKQKKKIEERLEVLRKGKGDEESKNLPEPSPPGSL